MSAETTRIGYVLKVFPRLSQTFIVNEIRAHEEAGLDLVIFSLKTPRESDVGVVEPPLRSRVVILAGPKESWPEQLASEVERRRISHLHAHFGNVAAAVARSAAAISGVEYSFTAHAIDVFDDKVDAVALRSKLEDAASVVTVSDYNVRHICEVHDRATTRIYNGLPLDQFTYRPDGRSSNRLLAIGRLVEKKGFSTLVDACHRLAAERDSFSCEIIGEGPLRSKLAAQISDHGLGGRIKLSGALRPAEVRERLRRATALVAPCRIAESGDRDGLPTVLIEAMALGTPVISTDVTGIPEIVIDGKTGVMVPPNNPERLALACRLLLDDPVLAKRMARTARRRIETHFDCRTTSARLRELWRSPVRRIVFRVHNRRGLGHWMRSMNIATELLALSPSLEVIIFARVRMSLAVSCDRIRQVIAKDSEKMGIAELTEMGLEPDLLIDDTILPPGRLARATKHVFVMRKRRASKLAELVGDERLRKVDLVIAPHREEEFKDQLPAWLVRKSLFVGPIARRAKPSLVGTLRDRYGLEEGEPLILSTPGGGGFPADFDRLWEIARAVHERLGPLGVRHIFISGPQAHASVRPPDEGMTIIDVESEMPTLLSMATAVISAGGYNTVNEIRLAKRPAFFVPGDRKYDDQRERVMELVQAGLAWSFEDAPAEKTAATIALRFQDASAMGSVATAYRQDEFKIGNCSAAKAILDCAIC